MGNFLSDVGSSTLTNTIEGFGWAFEIMAGGILTAAGLYYYVDFLQVNEIPIKVLGTSVSAAGVIGGGYLIYKGVQEKWYPKPPTEEECKQALEANTGGVMFYLGAFLRSISAGAISTKEADAAILSKTCRTNKKMVSYFGIPFWFDTKWEELPSYSLIALLLAGPFVLTEGAIIYLDSTNYWWQTLGLFVGTTGFMMFASSLGIMLQNFDADFMEKSLPLIGLVPSLFATYRGASYLATTSSTDAMATGTVLVFGGLSIFFAYRLIKNMLIYYKKASPAEEPPPLSKQRTLTASELENLQKKEEVLRQYTIRAINNNQLDLNNEEVYNGSRNEFASNACYNSSYSREEQSKSEIWNACNIQARKDYDSFFKSG